MRLPLRDDVDWGSLAGYFAGELSQSETTLLRAWIDADPAHATLVAELRNVWEAMGRPRRAWDAASALRTIKQLAAPPLHVVERGMGGEDHIVERGTEGEERRRWRVWAAAALVVLTAGAASWFTISKSLRARDSSPPMAQLATRRGQSAELLLSDGTRVTLGVASRLRYPVRYASRSRDLYLDGEAYFQVVHDARRLFRVHTDRGIAEDLGTAFAIYAYRGTPVEVVVAEGAVVLRAAGAAAAVSDSVVLGQADLGRVESDGRLSRTADVDVDDYLGWRQGRLVFRDTPLREVLDRLSRWYNLDLQLGDSGLGDRPFTASFDREPAARVLDVLAVTLRLRYERRGSLTLVFSRSARAPKPQ